MSGSNVYSTPTLHLTGDVNTGMPGKQVQVLVEVSIPSGTANGSYTTSYGVRTH
jgi:hypothetical protein